MKFRHNIKIFLFSLLLSSCVPGLSFEIENKTNEQIMIEYIIYDNLLSDGFEKSVVQILNINEKNHVIFSFNKFYNGPLYAGMTNDEYKNTAIFLTIFEDIKITLLESNIVMYKEDLEKYKTTYRKEGVSSNYWTIEIE